MATVLSVARAEAPAEVTRDLYERYGGQIFVFCLSQLGSREEAEDAVQSTFLNAFRGLSRGIAPTSESAWLFKIAHNVCLTRRRAIWRRGRVETAQDVEALQALAPARTPVDADELIALEEALGAMRQSQRRAILLREWQGLSYREIGEAMGLSQSAVEALIFRARRSLALRLEEPPKARRLARLRHVLDAGWFAAALKALLSGGTAAKAVATATAVTTAGVVAAGQLTADPERPARVPERTAPVLQGRAAVVSAPRSSVETAVRRVDAVQRPVGKRSTRGAVAPKAKQRPAKRQAAKPVVAPPKNERAAQHPRQKPPRPAASERRGASTSSHGKASGHVKQTRRPATSKAVEKKPKDQSRGVARADQGRSAEAKNPGSNKPVVPPPAQPEAIPPAPPPPVAAGDGEADPGRGGGKAKDKDATG